MEDGIAAGIEEGFAAEGEAGAAAARALAEWYAKDRGRFGSTWERTAMRTRYGGVYEGGDWVALPVSPYRIPGEAFDSDVTCAAFWSELEERGMPKGAGETAEIALAALDASIATS